jgi:type VI secretion system protein ImpA
MTGFGCVDIDVLSAQISDENRVGADPRTDTSLSSPYLALKDLRASTRANEKIINGPPPQTTEENSLYQAAEAGLPRQWSQIREVSQELLGGQAKDLEVASWLTEALVRHDGFPGLADGLALIRSLVENYWDEGLFPQEDEDGLETRLAPIIALNGLEGRASPLLQALRRIPITDGATDDQLQLWHFDEATEIAQIVDAQQQSDRLSAGGTSMGMLDAALLKSSKDFLRQTYTAAKTAREHFTAVLETLYTKTGDMPPGSMLSGALDRLISCYDSKVAHMLVDPEDGGDSTGDGGASGGGGSQGGVGGLNSREEAFQAILRIADYFDQREPQALLGHSLREVVRRGRLPMLGLLEELLPDNDQRMVFLQRSGIKIDSGGSSEY